MGWNEERCFYSAKRRPLSLIHGGRREGFMFFGGDQQGILEKNIGAERAQE